MAEVFFIDPMYIHYRKMWKEDRWKFSGELVRMTIKRSKEGLSEKETRIIEAMNRVIEENNGDWLGDYDWKTEGLKRKINMYVEKNK
jgi:hypothetical protein